MTSASGPRWPGVSPKTGSGSLPPDGGTTTSACPGAPIQLHRPCPTATGRIVGITSDDTAGNLPYGASKGAMDRIVLAAAVELAEQGVTANVINPGATDTGWMSPEIEQRVRQITLQPRSGLPADVANLVSFLCSPVGQWINGQLLYSNGGLR